MSNYLALTLEGVMLSFGNDTSRWEGHRGTSLLPTASAVQGLIGCVLGLDIDDPEFEQVKELDIRLKTPDTAYTIHTDDQNVHPKRPFIPASQEDCTAEAYSSFLDNQGFTRVDGKNATNDNLQVYKDYLINTEKRKEFDDDNNPIPYNDPNERKLVKFILYVGGNEKYLKKIHNAFLHPKYVYYIGRANCTPSERIVKEPFELIPLNRIEGDTVCI